MVVNNLPVPYKYNALLGTKYVYFKACVCYFLSNVYFSPYESFSKTEKCSLFHPKSSFLSGDIQIFVFLSSCLFSMSAIAFEVDRRKMYDVIKFMTSSTV